MSRCTRLGRSLYKCHQDENAAKNRRQCGNDSSEQVDKYAGREKKEPQNDTRGRVLTKVRLHSTFKLLNTCPQNGKKDANEGKKARVKKVALP